MFKNILIVGENLSSFMLKGMKTALEESGSHVTLANPDVDEINEVIGEQEIFLIYTDQTIEKFMEAIIFIRDYCLENEKKIYVIGYSDEIEQIQKIVSSKELIGGIFERPLNVKSLVEQLQEHAQKEEKEQKKKHILIVDDSGNMLRTIKSWLSPKYKVSMANSGAMAISFLATSHPDLILLDYEMPICSGPQFLEMIHAEPSTANIPVIFLTAKGDRESVEKVVALKPAGYLLKTMDSAEIVEKIDTFFAR